MTSYDPDCPEIIQVYATHETTRLNQNLYKKSNKKLNANDRIAARSSHSRNRPQDYTSGGSVRPAGATSRKLPDSNKAGPSGLSTERTPSNDSEEVTVDWMDKVFGTRKRKIARPKEYTKSRDNVKKKHGISTSLLRIRSRQQQSTRKMSKAWTEDSREQFLNSLTKDDYEQQKKDYLAKNAGKHDTEVLGIEIPLYDTYSYSGSSQRDTKKSKKSVAYRAKTVPPS